MTCRSRKMLHFGSAMREAVTEFWPDSEWDRAAPDDLGFDSSALDAYGGWLEAAAGEGPFGTVLARGGRIGFETYGGGGAADSTWEIGSIRKSVAAVLLDVAIQEGKLGLDDRVVDIWPEVALLTGEEKDRAITVRHLATNTSGWMRSERPGERWFYSNAACTAGHALIGRAYGLQDDEVAPLAAERVGRAIGASSWRCYHYEADFEPGNPGQPGPKLAVDSTVRDTARFGLLWLRRGRWACRHLMREAFAREATSDRVKDLVGCYGYWWFVNTDRQLLPHAPEDTFYSVGVGREDRRTILAVVPSLDLVAVVATDARAFDILKGYRERPFRLMDGWMGKVLKAVKSEK